MDKDTANAELTAEIVAAYVTKNVVQPDELPALIGAVHATLEGLDGPPAPEPQEKLKPAVPISRSVTPDYIICLENGEKFRSLKLHLRTRHNLPPEQYRAKWGLKPDYPMVAPNYAKVRSSLAKRIGLGRKRGE
ncbi:MAG: MucR family transcriptional regulator [Pseudomonadota bacterium]